jgi:hypothetical protein
MLLPGGKLQFEAGYAEKFNDRLDDYLISLDHQVTLAFFLPN